MHGNAVEAIRILCTFWVIFSDIDSQIVEDIDIKNHQV